MPGCPASDEMLSSVLDISFHRIKALAAMFLPLISRAAERTRPPRDPEGGGGEGRRAKERKSERSVLGEGRVLGLGEMRDRLRARGGLRRTGESEGGRRGGGVLSGMSEESKGAAAVMAGMVLGEGGLAMCM